MPYIKDDARLAIAETGVLQTPGELNYVFTSIAWNYILDNGLNYQNINDIMGALEGAKFELYRRIAAPYEDKKIIENGDVYGIEQQVAEANPPPELRREGVEL